jgi:predicted outer membrane protein
MRGAVSGGLPLKCVVLHRHGARFFLPCSGGNVSVPDAIDSKHQSRTNKLAKLSGAGFDKAYIKDQLRYHEQNVKDFQQEAQHGSVAEVKNFASKALPTLQQHRQLAKDLSESKDNA